MIESAPLKWILVLVSVSSGAWFLFRGTRPASGRAVAETSDRISHLAHVLMAAVMAAMVWLMG